jgi:hypothetical protein
MRQSERDARLTVACSEAAHARCTLVHDAHEFRTKRAM